MFVNRALWRIFGPKEDKRTGYRRKFHNQESFINFTPCQIVLEGSNQGERDRQPT
jgi:hypothetical protein